MATDVKLHSIGGSHPSVVILPKDWRVIPVNSTVVQIDRLVTDVGVDSQGARSLMRQSIITTLDQARLINAVLVAVLFAGETVPLAASFVACELPADLTSAVAVELTWKAAGRATERRSFPEGPGVMSTRVRQIEVAGAGDAIDVWELQVALPHPQSGGLLFSFSTPMVAVGEQLKAMALALVSTVRWNEEGRK